MKTLIRKELRENATLCVLGLVIWAFILGLIYLGYEHTVKGFALGGESARGPMQPLAEGDLQLSMAFFCGIFGALLGWFQAYHERHRDLWSYLVHRPATRTNLFFAKALAGLGLYVAAVGLPLAVFLGWAITPGHVAAPFEWSLLWPLLVFLLAGMACYFAGMLTGLRQARWYASRGLPLGTGLMIIATSAATPRPGQAVGLVLLGGALLAMACWSGFQTNGFYRGQPRWGRLALAVVLMVGCMPLMILVLGLAQIVVPRALLGEFSWSRYEMTTNGIIYKVITKSDRPPAVVDLEGKPLLDPKTGKVVEADRYTMLVKSMARSASLSTPPEAAVRRYMGTADQEGFLGATPNMLWYYWPRYGRVVGFDAVTRRARGSLGPNGFTPDLAGGGVRFTNVPATALTHSWPMLHTASTVYRLFLENRTSTPVFKSDPADPVLDATEMSAYETAPSYVAVLTKQRVCVLTGEGRPAWQAPYAPGEHGEADIRVWLLEPPGHFALWVKPAHQPDGRTAASDITQVTWFTGDQSTKTMQLPPADPSTSNFSRYEIASGLLLPPLVVGISPAFLGAPWPEGFRRALDMACYGLAVGLFLCIPPGWWLSRRYSFSLSSRLGWALFLLLGGLPGLLAFLSAQEWPAREPCAQCGRRRTVERETCEHCGAPFPPPDKLGIEIFEPAPAT